MYAGRTLCPRNAIYTVRDSCFYHLPPYFDGNDETKRDLRRDDLAESHAEWRVFPASISYPGLHCNSMQPYFLLCLLFGVT